MMLSGLKVIELATWVAAPGCAMIMAEWGADVIKVESPAGDATRAFFPDTPESPANPVFSMENRGKRGVVLDTSRADGRKALLSLLDGADVFITNLRPGALQRAGLDYARLEEAHPRLIYASVSGYGLTGADADIPAFDLTGFWTRTGVAFATIPPDQTPFPCRPGFGDHCTALAMLSGILAAVHERGRTGRGRLVETSLVRAGVYALAWDFSAFLRYGQQETARPRDERPSALAGFFRTADDRYLCVIPRGLPCFPALLGALDLPGLASEPRFAPPIADLAVVRELRSHLDAGFARLSLAEAGQRLTAADLVWAPMASLGEAVADVQLQAAGCFTTSPDRFGGVFAAPAQPVRFDATSLAPRRPAPALGEHTREALREVGLSDTAVADLLASGAAVQAAEAPP